MILVTPLLITLLLYSHKHFSDYLANENGSTIFLQPTDKKEIANIKSSLNSDKTSGPNSIPCTMLFLSKNEAIGRFIQPFFHDCFFQSVLKNCRSYSCFYERFKIKLQ